MLSSRQRRNFARSGVQPWRYPPGIRLSLYLAIFVATRFHPNFAICHRLAGCIPTKWHRYSMIPFVLNREFAAAVLLPHGWQRLKRSACKR
jgi:hypothetical protein